VRGLNIKCGPSVGSLCYTETTVKLRCPDQGQGERRVGQSMTVPPIYVPDSKEAVTGVWNTVTALDAVLSSVAG